MQFTRNSLRDASGSTKLLVSPLPLLDELPLRGVALTELRDDGLKRQKHCIRNHTLLFMNFFTVIEHFFLFFLPFLNISL